MVWRIPSVNVSWVILKIILLFSFFHYLVANTHFVSKRKSQWCKKLASKGTHGVVEILADTGNFRKQNYILLREVLMYTCIFLYNQNERSRGRRNGTPLPPASKLSAHQCKYVNHQSRILYRIEESSLAVHTLAEGWTWKITVLSVHICNQVIFFLVL